MPLKPLQIAGFFDYLPHVRASWEGLGNGHGRCGGVDVLASVLMSYLAIRRRTMRS